MPLMASSCSQKDTTSSPFDKACYSKVAARCWARSDSMVVVGPVLELGEGARELAMDDPEAPSASTDSSSGPDASHWCQGSALTAALEPLRSD